MFTILKRIVILQSHTKVSSVSATQKEKQSISGHFKLSESVNTFKMHSNQEYAFNQAIHGHENLISNARHWVILISHKHRESITPIEFTRGFNLHNKPNSQNTLLNYDQQFPIPTSQSSAGQSFLY